MHRTLLAWLLYFGLLGIELFIDYQLRMQDGNVRTGGIPEMLLFALFWIQAFAAAILLWQGTRELNALWKRFSFFGLQVGLGFIAHVAIGLWYVVGHGIDSL